MRLLALLVGEARAGIRLVREHAESLAVGAVDAVAGALVGKNVPLGDGVDGPDRQRLGVFPYEADPGSGFANEKGK